ncbi:MAG TPA: secondary thiamine-phosphate synthase enzyme YjbQ, partial [Candidatus Binataceae bacterium]|nr:secondary thiamine-phosphate synthase enzyme YjbQ [Candidatus Binataceae bacterium]
IAQGEARHSIALYDALFEIRSTEPIQFIDLTSHINRQLAENRIESGHVLVFSRHTTAAIKINEAEELLLEDFKSLLHGLCPPERSYCHNDMSRRKPPIAPDERPNAHSHLMHLLLSTSEYIPVVDGRLALGTWQSVFLVELDGPRNRQVMLRCTSYQPNRTPQPLRIATQQTGHGHRQVELALSRGK